MVELLKILDYLGFITINQWNDRFMLPNKSINSELAK